MFDKDLKDVEIYMNNILIRIFRFYGLVLPKVGFSYSLIQKMF